VTQGTDLLRMLEPAVRPGNVPASQAQVRQPIEGRSFESLLDEAQQMDGSEPADTNAGEKASPPKGAGPLGGLSQVDRIENASLWKWLGGQSE